MEHRVQVTSVYYVAAILSASICLGCLNVTGEKSWRIPCWCQMLGAGLTLLMTCTIPESPRVRIPFFLFFFFFLSLSFLVVLFLCIRYRIMADGDSSGSSRKADWRRLAPFSSNTTPMARKTMSLSDMSSRKLSRPSKKRRTSHRHLILTFFEAPVTATGS